MILIMLALYPGIRSVCCFSETSGALAAVFIANKKPSRGERVYYYIFVQFSSALNFSERSFRGFSKTSSYNAIFFCVIILRKLIRP